MIPSYTYNQFAEAEKLAKSSTITNAELLDIYDIAAPFWIEGVGVRRKLWEDIGKICRQRILKRMRCRCDAQLEDSA